MEDVTIVDKPNTVVNIPVTHKPEYDTIDPDRNRFLKFAFVNKNRLPYEVFYNYRKYTDFIFENHRGIITEIYIKLDTFLLYYGLKHTDDIEGHFNIILRPDGSTEEYMTNIHPNYNGVMVPSEKFYYPNNKLIYDNGYPICADSDIEYNTLYPINLLMAFPQKKLANHHINALIFPVGYKGTNRKYYVKYKNLTQTDKDNIESWKVLTGNHLIVDYIDFTYILKVNHIILTEGVDYEILSSRIIKFKKLPIYDDSSDYLVFEKEIQGTEFKVLRHSSYYNSFKNLFYFNQRYINTYKNNPNDCLIDIYYPENYSKEINRQHQFVTRFLSTELVMDLENDMETNYSKEWLDVIKEEYPEFVKEVNGNTILDINPQVNYKLKPLDVPRFVSLPEPCNLNYIIFQHMIASKYINENDMSHGKDYFTNLNRKMPIVYDNNNRRVINNNLKIRNINVDKYLLKMSKLVNPNFINGNFQYTPNIPLDFIIIK